MALLDPRDLHGEVGIDAAASGLDVDLGAERRGKTYSDATGARVYLQVLDSAEQLELRAAAAGVDINARRAHPFESHSAGTDVGLQIGNVDVSAMYRAGSRVHAQRFPFYAGDRHRS